VEHRGRLYGQLWAWEDRTASDGYRQARNAYSVPLFFPPISPYFSPLTFRGYRCMP
jgi:hypothetical protein